MTAVAERAVALPIGPNVIDASTKTKCVGTRGCTRPARHRCTNCKRELCNGHAPKDRKRRACHKCRHVFSEAPAMPLLGTAAAQPVAVIDALPDEDDDDLDVGRSQHAPGTTVFLGHYETTGRRCRRSPRGRALIDRTHARTEILAGELVSVVVANRRRVAVQAEPGAPHRDAIPGDNEEQHDEDDLELDGEDAFDDDDDDEEDDGDGDGDDTKGAKGARPVRPTKPDRTAEYAAADAADPTFMDEVVKHIQMHRTAPVTAAVVRHFGIRGLLAYARTIADGGDFGAMSIRYDLSEYNEETRWRRVRSIASFAAEVGQCPECGVFESCHTHAPYPCDRRAYRDGIAAQRAALIAKHHVGAKTKGDPAYGWGEDSPTYVVTRAIVATAPPSWWRGTEYQLSHPYYYVALPETRGAQHRRYDEGRHRQWEGGAIFIEMEAEATRAPSLFDSL